MLPVAAYVPHSANHQHHGNDGIEFVEVRSQGVPAFAQLETNPSKHIAPDERASEGVNHKGQ